jgi:hypothetical protein
MTNCVEFTNYWIYNNDTMVVKHEFDSDISLLNFDDKITILTFNCGVLKHIIKNNNYRTLSYFNQQVDKLPLHLFEV